MRILFAVPALALAVPFAFTERTEGVMALRRGFRIEDGTRVLVVEDVVTTGGSTREVMDVVQRHGGVVVGVASMVDRSGTKHPFSPLPYTTLLTLEIPNFSP